MSRDVESVGVLQMWCSGRRISRFGWWTDFQGNSVELFRENETMCLCGERTKERKKRKEKILQCH